ncbi:Drug resistance transporter, EmrB/QacA subfamily [Methylocella tundrae]|uniref:Drug resistance transporter, EmrB/QacA subfamily n=2 Tax=Methylocella tundrae TaxID=227605 RepID=A0A8B6M769_METTU|nr:Drug resistance transporter, EmrB/QacA subfamily [Methylocella tundrae]
MIYAAGNAGERRDPVMKSSVPRLPLIVLAASFGFVVVQLDVTIVNVALVSIGRDLHAPVSDLQWIVDAYTLLFAAFLLSAGALGDRTGPKRAFLAGFALFAAASAACGLAGDSGMLIAARAVQGAAAALLVPPSLALLAHACGDDARTRARAVGWWTAAGGVSIAAGPVVGGLLIGTLGWRSIFLVNLPLCAIGAALTFVFAPEAPAHKKRPVDLAGQALAFLALASLVGAVIEAGRLGWGDRLPLGLLAAAVAAAAGFLAVEARGPHPVVPLSVFRNRIFSSAVVIGVTLNFAYYGMIFVLALFLQRAAGYSTIETGLAFLPLTATFIASNLASGPAVERFGAGRVTVAGVLIAAMGYAATGTLSAASPFIAMVPGFILIPAGMGVAVPALTSALLSSVDRHWSGTASGVFNAARQAGGAAGVAVFGALAAGDGMGIAAGLRAASAVAAGVLLFAALIGASTWRRA